MAEVMIVARTRERAKFLARELGEDRPLLSGVRNAGMVCRGHDLWRVVVDDGVELDPDTLDSLCASLHQRGGEIELLERVQRGR